MQGMRKFTAVVRPAEEGGFWAEVLELEGCVSQGETEDELFENVMEAIQACLDAGTPYHTQGDRMPEVWKIPVMA